MTTHQRVALVTGAGTGIGKHLTLALLQEGYAVVLAGRRAELLEQTVAEAGAAEEKRQRSTVLTRKDAPFLLRGPWSCRPTWATRLRYARCSPKPARRSAGWTCCSTMRAAARRRFPSKTCPTSSGRAWSM